MRKKYLFFVFSSPLTCIVQDREKSIQPASNEGSDSVDDGVERIEGSSSNSSELNDSGDQEIDSQQEQEAEEMIAESRGAFHSTKYSCLKFRVFHATNGTVFSGSLDHPIPGHQVPSFARENTRSNGWLFYFCLLALGLLDDSEVEINDVLGEGDNITFIVRI